MQLYTTNLTRVTVSPHSRRASVNLAFVNVLPLKAIISEALTKLIEEAERSPRDEYDDENFGIDQRLHDLTLAKQIVDAASMPNELPGWTLDVRVAEISIGTIKFDTEDVWYVE